MLGITVYGYVFILVLLIVLLLLYDSFDNSNNKLGKLVTEILMFFSFALLTIG